jgi:NADPH2:quinone reductase
LSEIAPLFDSGTLSPPAVSEQYPLAEAREAYGRVASGQGGKIVLVMPAGGEDVAGAAVVERNTEA